MVVEVQLLCFCTGMSSGMWNEWSRADSYWGLRRNAPLHFQTAGVEESSRGPFSWNHTNSTVETVSVPRYPWGTFKTKILHFQVLLNINTVLQIQDQYQSQNLNVHIKFNTRTRYKTLLVK